jgi:hypothetical protein
MSLIARAVTAILVLSMIPLAFLTPGSQGQGITTVTSLQTITTAVSTTSTEVITVQSASTSTFTSYYTTTSYLNKALQLYRLGFSLESTEGGIYCGRFYGRYFSAKSNQVISIIFTSNIPVDFFVMSSKDYNAWVGTRKCPVTRALLEQYSVDSVSMNVTIPESGSYYFMFLNTSPDTTAKIKLSADIVGVAAPSSLVTTTEVVSTSQSTTTWTFPVTMTLVLTSVHTEQMPPSLGQDNTIVVAIVGIVVLTAVILLVMRRRGKTAVKPKPPTVPIPAEIGQLCPKCGSRTPSGSNF